MSQIVPVGVPLGAPRSGLAIGCIIYALDGTTVISVFSAIGWYEAPAGSGSYHHPGVSVPDVGGVVAVGTSGQEFVREAVPSVIIDTGVSMEIALKKMFSVIVGSFIANAPDATQIVYYAADGVTPLVTHDLTDTTRDLV